MHEDRSAATSDSEQTLGTRRVFQPFNWMTRYSFLITDGDDFSDNEELPDDEAAWHQALRTVRDIESTLSSTGGKWSLVVHRDDSPLYRIDVRAQRLT
ncbi:hypothetical protein A5906_30055 [Bradyrhizobium sacchari]|uniref:DUF6894 domain-containing protein n=1 Tax=Bradyrhizobium sacchari TaxID=1399419 RepID=A0A560JS20_9BRAD|nr:hypothetical protein [Bradyrhizobium sacchari]OPY98820.1 hypothetical protein A5906_30055 [Bradyrhizobium sacchari]TWB60285.1 hypothetical protein FBZ94_104509 [Bradyrhizobium sacchari]TWB73905.1 hypothetical protein FBZ95_105156 [Bradyrhizobium sacchari]